MIQDGPGGGVVALTKATTGILTLSGVNTYSGGTTDTSGEIIVAATGAFAGE